MVLSPLERVEPTLDKNDMFLLNSEPWETKRYRTVMCKIP